MSLLGETRLGFDSLNDRQLAKSPVESVQHAKGNNTPMDIVALGVCPCSSPRPSNCRLYNVLMREEEGQGPPLLFKYASANLVKTQFI